MKKIIAVLLSVLMVLALAACGAPTDSATETKAAETTAAAQDEPEAEQQADGAADERGGKILVVWFSANNFYDVDAVSSATPMIGGVSATASYYYGPLQPGLETGMAEGRQ